MKEFKPISWMIKTQLPTSTDPPADGELQADVIKYWKENAGIAAPYTYPLLFQSGRLVLFCDSAVWATQIRHQTPSLLRQFNESGFCISTIKTKIRPMSVIQKSRSKYNATEPISQENAIAINNLAKKVSHQGLNKALSRLSKRTVKNK